MDIKANSTRNEDHGLHEDAEADERGSEEQGVQDTDGAAGGTTTAAPRQFPHWSSQLPLPSRKSSRATSTLTELLWVLPLGYKNKNQHKPKQTFSPLGKEMLAKFTQRMFRGGNRSQNLDQPLGTPRSTINNKNL